MKIISLLILTFNIYANSSTPDPFLNKYCAAKGDSNNSNIFSTDATRAYFNRNNGVRVEKFEIPDMYTIDILTCSKYNRNSKFGCDKWLVNKKNVGFLENRHRSGKQNFEVYLVYKEYNFPFASKAENIFFSNVNAETFTNSCEFLSDIQDASAEPNSDNFLPVTWDTSYYANNGYLLNLEMSSKALRVIKRKSIENLIKKANEVKSMRTNEFEYSWNHFSEKYKIEIPYHEINDKEKILIEKLASLKIDESDANSPEDKLRKINQFRTDNALIYVKMMNIKDGE